MSLQLRERNGAGAECGEVAGVVVAAEYTAHFELMLEVYEEKERERDVAYAQVVCTERWRVGLLSLTGAANFLLGES